jgi:polyphosphate glucokinase
MAIKKKDLEKSEAKILSIDIGGSKVKMLATGHMEPRKEKSGPTLTPIKLVKLVRDMTEDWEYDAITIGFPGLVSVNGPISEPGNLGRGWVGFDFNSAFAKPVKVINDAAMQALGSYEGGRMLFLGFGTGLGSTLIAQNAILSLELSMLRWDRKASIGDVVSREAMKRLGKTEWSATVTQVIGSLTQAFAADYTVIGGGNARYIEQMPPGARLGHNQTAFRGGQRIWSLSSVHDSQPEFSPGYKFEWRII